MCLLIIKLFQFTTYGQILIKFYNFPLLFLTGNSNWWKDSFLLTYNFPLRLLDITTTTFSNPYLTSNLGLIFITHSFIIPIIFTLQILFNWIIFLWKPVKTNHLWSRKRWFLSFYLQQYKPPTLLMFWAVSIGLSHIKLIT